MRCLSWLLAGVLIVGSHSTVWSQVHSPRLVPAGGVDSLSLSTWVASLNQAELSDRDFALRLLESVAGSSGALALQEFAITEGEDAQSDYARVTDPVRLHQVHGGGDERQLAGVFVALWEASGRGQGRVLRFAESPHALAEIESQGHWWVFDVARRGSFATSATSFATLEELKTKPELWQQPRGPEFYPDVAPDEIRDLLAQGKPQRQYAAVAQGTSADFVLRRGERWTWYFQPQGARWLLSTRDTKDKVRSKWLETEPAGPKLADNTPSYANAVLVYEPQLTAASEHFADGAIASSNLQVTADGLTVQEAGVGWAIFEMRSPYPIVPELGKLADKKDDKEAAIVEIDGAAASLTVSYDNAVTWLSLEAKKFPARVDMTNEVAGWDGYLLRIELNGKPGEAIVKSLKLTTWLQINPRALAAVEAGKNSFEVRRNDELGLPTRSFRNPVSTTNDNAFLAPVIRPPRELHTGAASGRVMGPFTVRVAPPLGTRLSWLTCGGRFAVDVEHPAESLAILGDALRVPFDFQTVTAPPLPADHAGFDREWDRVLRFDERPALNDVRLTVHGLAIDPRPETPWIITHRWRENDAPKEHVQEVTPETTAYEFAAGEHVSNESIEFFRP